MHIINCFNVYYWLDAAVFFASWIGLKTEILAAKGENSTKQYSWLQQQQYKTLKLFNK